MEFDPPHRIRKIKCTHIKKIVLEFVLDKINAISNRKIQCLFSNNPKDKG